jgi:hypothetical protein
VSTPVHYFLAFSPGTNYTPKFPAWALRRFGQILRDRTRRCGLLGEHAAVRH